MTGIARVSQASRTAWPAPSLRSPGTLRNGSCWFRRERPRNTGKGRRAPTPHGACASHRSSAGPAGDRKYSDDIARAPLSLGAGERAESRGSTWCGRRRGVAEVPPGATDDAAPGEEVHELVARLHPEKVEEPAAE